MSRMFFNTTSAYGNDSDYELIDIDETQELKDFGISLLKEKLKAKNVRDGQYEYIINFKKSTLRLSPEDKTFKVEVKIETNLEIT